VIVALSRQASELVEADDFEAFGPIAEMLVTAADALDVIAVRP